MIAIVLALASQAPLTADVGAKVRCSLSRAEMDANAKLTFKEFDQAGTLPSTWRALTAVGCWQQAIDALRDYAIRGPVPEPDHQRIMLFHMGQTLATAGDEQRAADFIGFSREPAGSRPPENLLAWNDYVIGTWAFLTKDLTLLEESRDHVLAAPGEGNKINGGILAGLVRCFKKPYSVAYNPKSGCQTR